MEVLMFNPKTRLFFGIGTTMPIHRATDLIGHLPQEKRHHYRDGYSMAEAAKCWMRAGGRLPQRVAALIGDDTLETAHFEYGVKVWGSGRSMTDIMAFIPGDLIAVEAKARERLGSEVRDWVDQDKAKNPRSPPYRLKVVDRYARSLDVPRDALLGLRYQLLHRTLAAALVAKRNGRRKAWMIVQSFAPSECDEHVRNRADFDRYVALARGTPVLEGIPVRLGWVDELI
jgi:Domain of unknown function (DUF6946)